LGGAVEQPTSPTGCPADLLSSAGAVAHARVRLVAGCTARLLCRHAGSAGARRAGALAGPEVCVCVGGGGSCCIRCPLVAHARTFKMTHACIAHAATHARMQCARSHACTPTATHARTHANMQRLHSRARSHARRHARRHTRAHVHARTPTCKPAHLHTHACTHAQLLHPCCTPACLCLRHARIRSWGSISLNISHWPRASFLVPTGCRRA
jgi:hypothetical protein